MERPAKSSDLVPLFAALADRTRLRLLNLMRDREVCVCYFVEILRQGQPKISRHLAYLRKAGIASARREGRCMHYKIEWPQDPRASAILETTRTSLSADRQMLADLARLNAPVVGRSGLSLFKVRLRPRRLRQQLRMRKLARSTDEEEPHEPRNPMV